MKTLLNLLNRTANAAKISGGGNSRTTKHLFAIIALLLTLGVTNTWGENTKHPIYCAIKSSSLGEGYLDINVHKGGTYDGGVWYRTRMTKIATTITKAETNETKDLYYAEIEYVDAGLQELQFEIWNGDESTDSNKREFKTAFSSWWTSDGYTKPIFDYENGNFTTYPASLAEKTSYVYFDAADWTDDYIQLCVGHGLYQGYNQLEHLTNTTLYYAKPTLNYGDAVVIAFLGHHENFSSGGNWLTNMPYWADHYTGYLHYSLSENHYHFFRRSENAEKGDAISFSYNENEASLLSTLNKAQTVQARVKATGSSYSDASFASWPGSVSVERTYMSSATATSSPSAANMTSATTDAVLTSSITLTASANSGYYFEGWGDASDSNPTDGTAAKTYTITDTKTSYAFFSQAYTLTYAPQGDYSTSTVTVYSVDGYGGATATGSSIPTGHMITLVATPATGYEVEGWYSDASCETAYTDGSGEVTIEDGNNTFKLASLNANTEVYCKFRPITYTVTLQGMEADSDEPILINITYNAELSSPVSGHTKEHYDFRGYWTDDNDAGATLVTQLIDDNYDWKKNISPYTSNDETPKWIYPNNLSIFAKWEEIKYDVAVSVSPAEAGSVQVGGVAISKIENIGFATHSPVLTAVPSNAAWVFKEWQVTSDAKLDLESYTRNGTTMEITATDDGQTLTAVFEKRYNLLGSKYESDKDKAEMATGGMPGWTYGSGADFTINSYDADGDNATVNMSYTCNLEAGTYMFEIHDRKKRESLGRTADGGGIYELADGGSVELHGDAEKDKSIFFYPQHAGQYTFRITYMTKDDEYYYPTVTIERPHQMHFAHKRVDIDGNDHNDDLGGTLTATINEESAANEQWFDYGSDVAWTATAETGYSLTWYTDNAYSNAMNPQPEASWNDPDITHDENIYAKFTETPTTVTLSNDGHGKVQIGGEDATSTTCGVTTTRELTAVPNDGYMFSSWTKTSGDDITISSTSTNPTTLSGQGAGAASGQTVTANFTYRWALKAESGNWGSTEFTIENISVIDGKTIGYVDISLAANTNYQFTIKDKLNDDIYKIGGTSVLYMNHDNCTNWELGTGDGRSNCGITTAGKGTYRFSWNPSTHKLSVTYPAAQLISCGAATENGGSGGSITAIKDEANNDYSNGQYISEGNTITFTATANEGYEFVGWFSNNEYNAVPVTNVNPWNFTVAEPVNVYALFAEENVYYFDGNNGTSTDWTTPTNWTRKVVPTTSSHSVRILKPVTVSNGTKVHVANVDIVTGGSFTPAGGSALTASGQLNIADGGMLIVAGSVKKVADASAMSTKTPTDYDDLNIGSTLANGNGALVMGSHDGTNKAHVTFATKAKKDNDGHNVNQFIGTPFNDENYILYNYYGTKIYEFKAARDGNKGANNEWQRLPNDGDMTPFWGYNILTSQTTSPTLWMQGTLNSSDNHVTNLYYKTGDTQTENMLANSWISPIDITKFQDSDFSANVEQTIYIYNAGTVADEETAGDGAADASSPGQWIVLPINSMPWTSPTVTVIPSMQAFSVYVTAASQTLTMDYDRLVYNPAVNGTATIVPNRAPHRYTEEEAPSVLKIRVSGESGYSDQIVLLSREDFTFGYDNGWDGRKIMGDDAAPQLYTITQDGKMSIDCTPQIEGTLVGFKPGEADPFYIIRFDYDGDETLYLNDLQMQLSTPIDAEHTYSFSAYANDAESRFVISATPISQTATGIDRTETVSELRKIIIHDHLYIIRQGRIYTAHGQLVK